jgi:hypothetical protein
MNDSNSGKVTIWLMVGGLTYSLSLGPMVALCEHQIIPDRVGEVYFAPIIPLAKVPVVRGVIRRYVELWMLPDSD